jgi:hypothetical protein
MEGPRNKASVPFVDRTKLTAKSASDMTDFSLRDHVIPEDSMARTKEIFISRTVRKVCQLPHFMLQRENMKDIYR